jgi:fermentation-respiration switch protein FrsA (DUF1100 family)
MIRRRHAALSLVALVTVSLPGCVLARPARAVIAPPPASLDAEPVAFQSASGSLIRGWLARGRAGGGAVLLLHGVGANRTSMLGRARFLHAAGYTVLAPDFQAHGESPGEHITFGALESLDAAAAMAFLRTAVPVERVGVIGVSMGGAAAVLGPDPLATDALVLESVYPTIRQATKNRLATWFGPFRAVGRLFAPIVISIVSTEIGVSEKELEPIARVGRVHAPILIASGTDDPYTPLAEAESLYAHAAPPKMFWPVSGARHEDLYEFAPAEYERRVGAFLAEHLRRASHDASYPGR